MDVQQAGAASEAALTPYAILDTAPEAAYDDLVQLARDLCGTPVALLTLFESGRQWFKAAVGFDGGETTLDDALCRHAIDAGDVLVIPDLTVDPRTAGNALVRGGPEARFYAGAPLRAPDGTFLGTVCVIDLVPRPAGLTDAQIAGLRTLAAQVMSMLELRRLLHERDTALDRGSAENRRLRESEQFLARSEAHWRGLFEGMREGFMVGELIRDADGHAIDWRHLEANAAFQDVVGHAAGDVIGRTVREVAPEIPDRWIAFVAQVVESGHAATFNQAVDRGSRHYEGRAFPIGDDQFAIIFLDITERVAGERRQLALIAVSDGLRDLDRVDDMTRVVARIVGETCDAVRASYGRLDPVHRTITVEPDWTAPGIASIAGVHRYADYGNLLDELLAGEPLIIDDVGTDPHTAADPRPMRALGVEAQVQMPVRERGRTVAALFVHLGRPHRWSQDELTFLRDVTDRLEIALSRLEANERRALQNEELSHRLKNTLAIVQAIASQTLKPVGERAVVDTFERRLSALATAHDVLLGSAWKVAPLDIVVSSVLDAAGQDGRVTLDGPSVDMSPRAVLSVSLLIHELATNAVKYGALSAPAGGVAVSWTVRSQDGRPTLFFEWREHGGPPAAVPTRRGFGSRLINMGLAGTGAVDLSYDPVGFSARMSAPLDDLTKT